MRRRAEVESLRDELQWAKQDVAQAQETAEQLRKVIARLHAALDALPLGVVVVDAQGDEQYRNREAERLIDARHAEALAGRALQDALVDVPAEATSRIVELHGPPPRTFSLAASPLAGDDGPIGRVAVVQDVTDRHRLDAVRRDFVANVSHELRTPIGAIVALADTLTVDDDETDPAVLRRLAERLAHEAERASHLIDDLLDLSRVEAGELEFEEVTVDQLVAACVRRVVASAGARAPDVSVVGQPPATRILVDRTQLEAAIVNLIENAIKYSDPGAPVLVSAVDDREGVDFVVRDEGIGIPPADRDRIFERFYRVDRARSRVTGGTGLGLSIVRNVARNHGGEVHVESREGEGSTFVIRLPRNASGPAAIEDR